MGSILTRTLLIALSSGVTIGLLATSAQAVGYQFTLVADIGGTYDGRVFTGFPGRPAINDNGDVSFRADFTAVSAEEGVYVYKSASGVSTILDSTDTVDSQAIDQFGAYVSLNNSGTVAVTDMSNNRILTSDGTTHTEVYEMGDSDGTGSTFFQFGIRPQINNNGMVGFAASYDSDTKYGVFRGNGSTPVLLQEHLPSGPYIDEPMTNDSNEAAWYADGGGLYINQNGATHLVAAQSSYPAATFGTPINSQGEAAFSAGPVGEDGPQSGFHVVSFNGGVTTLVDSDGPFGSIDNVAISYDPEAEERLIAFSGTLDMEGEEPVLVQGIYTGASPTADKVIETGDTIFGDEVINLTYFGWGLNNSGQIAFMATLDDGASQRQAIVLAEVTECIKGSSVLKGPGPYLAE